MIKNLRMDRPRADQRNTRDQSTSRIGNQLALMRQPTKPITHQPSKIVESDTTPEILHKEVFNNNLATVEVTVRATPQHLQPHANITLHNKCEPWQKSRLETSGDENCTFSNFDPVRTLHFLSKELQLKLQSSCPDDPNLQQIINDMQHAMQRLPPNCITQLQENIMKDSSGDTKLVNLQNENTNQLQETIKKLEEEVKNKGTIIEELQKEKQQVTDELTTEKVTHEKIEKDMESLKEQRDKLQEQVKDLEVQLTSQSLSAAQDLKTLTEELRTKYVKMQKENVDVRNELAQITLSKDKLNVLLECKEKQLEELRNELRNIQSFICARVNQTNSDANLSESSSISNMSKVWNIPMQKSSRCSSKQFYLNSEASSQVTVKLLNAESNITTTFTETDFQRDSLKPSKQKKLSKDKVLSSNTTITTQYKIKEKYSSMRALFSEIKRQAYRDSNITLSSCQPFNDLNSLCSG